MLQYTAEWTMCLWHCKTLGADRLVSDAWTSAGCSVCRAILPVFEERSFVRLSFV